MFSRPFIEASYLFLSDIPHFFLYLLIVIVLFPFVVLRGVDGQSMVIPRDEIEILRALPQSVMPEGALKDLNEQQIRDLFAYIRSTQPLNN